MQVKEKRIQHLTFHGLQSKQSDPEQREGDCMGISYRYSEADNSQNDRKD